MSERRVKFTTHGYERAKVMGVSRRDVLEVVLYPEQSWTTKTHNEELRTTYQRGDLAVVCAEGGKVITVLLARQEQWDRNQDRPRMATK